MQKEHDHDINKRAIIATLIVATASILGLISLSSYLNAAAWLTVERLIPSAQITEIGIIYDTEEELAQFLKLNEAIDIVDAKYAASEIKDRNEFARTTATVIASNSEGNRLLELAGKKEASELVPRTAGSEGFVIKTQNGNLYYLTIEFKQTGSVFPIR